MQPGDTSWLRRFWRTIVGWWGLLVLVAAIVLVAGFYLEENVSGKRAWEKYKRELEAKGEVLEWQHYVPAVVPDEQNIFGAPNMQAWFVRGGLGNLGSRLSPTFAGRSRRVPGPLLIGRVTIVTNLTAVTESDLIVRYSRPMLMGADSPDARALDDAAKEPIIPLIVLDEVPLSDAIRNLARSANLDCTFDPKIWTDGVNRQPSVSIRWENITARRALTAVLNNYNLLLRIEPGTGRAQIIPVHPGKFQVFVDSTVREALVRSLREAVAPLTTNEHSLGLKAPQGFTLVPTPLGPVQPFRLFVCAEEAPDPGEISAFFPSDALSSLLPDNGRLRVERTASNCFDVILNSAPCYSAAEYLEWSGQFEPDFEFIRRALKRPAARMAGDYSQPSQIPIPDFVCIRMVAQTLAQRGQASLLLGNTEQALRELTLLHDLGRLLDTKPTTLVAAMIKVAISGLYVSTVADGLRLNVWQESQLATLQAQLADIDLVPTVLEAFREERAGVCRTLEITPSGDLPRLWSGRSNTTLWQKVTDPSFWLLKNVPRGWIYQNIVVFASNQQKLLECFDSRRQMLCTQRIEMLCCDTEKTFRRFAPRTFIAAMATPNFMRAWQTLAITQTKVNQARIVCALERYRLAEGRHPATLEDLASRILDKVPTDLMTGQPLHYVLKDNDRFLLYSVGWNEKDDAGFVAKTPNGQVDRNHGDWVWDSDQPGG
jgi:hypothetical protein